MFAQLFNLATDGDNALFLLDKQRCVRFKHRGALGAEI